MRKLRGEAVWLGFGQLGIALGGFVAVYILTTLLTPAEYGTFTLLLGFSALAMLVGVTPFLQAGMRFLPVASRRGQKGATRRLTMEWVLRTLALACVASVAIGLAASERLSAPTWIGFLVGLLLISDAQRAFETSLLNAARRQRPMVAWRVSDALARPLVALGVIALFGAGAWQAILGYALATLLVNAVFLLNLNLEGGPAVGTVQRTGSVKREEIRPAYLRRGMRRYALPLVPSGLIGWINGIGDRYVIAALLTLEATGLFAAVYAITSRPYLALVAFQDALFRPRLYDALANGDEPQAQRIVLAWLITSGTIGGVGVIVAALAHEFLATLLLGVNFREASALMPVIALGYVVVAVQAPVGRCLHALYRTDYIFAVQLLTTISGIATTVAGVLFFGIWGAAMALPIYFGCEFAATLYFFRRAWSNYRSSPIKPGVHG